MNRKLILTIAMLIASAVSVSATELNSEAPLPFDVPNGVKDTVSAAYGIPNVLIQNDYNMFYAPGTMLKYGTAYGEVWQGNPWGGASFKLPIGVKAVLFLGRGYKGTLSDKYAKTVVKNARGLPSMGLANELGIRSTNGLPITMTPALLDTTFFPQHSFDILIGKKIGSMGVGLKYSLFYNSDLNEVSAIDSPSKNTNNGTLRNSRSVAEHHVTLGLTMEKVLVIDSLDIALDVAITKLDLKYEQERFGMKKFVSKSLVADGLPSFSLLARPIIRISDSSTLVSLLSFEMKDTSSTYKDRADLDNDGEVSILTSDRKEDYVFKDKSTGIVALAALHTSPMENLKLIYSAGCNFSVRNQENSHLNWTTNTYEASLKTTTLQFPLGVSIEYAFNDRFVSRLGVVKYVYENIGTEGTDKALTGSREDYSTSTVLPQDDGNSFRITAGLGFKINDLDLDVVLATTTYNFASLVTGASLKYRY